MVTSNGVTNVVDTVYDASMPMEEIGYAQGTNTPYPSAIYLIGPRGPEYRRDVVHQSVSWYVYDGLGSVVEEVDPSRNITASRKYDVYGLVRTGQLGSSSQKYVGSLGHESEGSTGLIYMRARYMDPVLGRFLSEDPSEDGVNWFVYCGDEPINGVDCDGKVDIANIILYSLFIGLWLKVVTGLADVPMEIIKDFCKAALKYYRLDGESLFQRLVEALNKLQRTTSDVAVTGETEEMLGGAIDDTGALEVEGSLEAGSSLTLSVEVSAAEENIHIELYIIMEEQAGDDLDE